MTDIRSLRTLLLVNTLVSGALLFSVLMTNGPFASTAASAGQYRSTRTTNPPSPAVTGVGNAAARQRDRMITGLDSISKRLQSVEKRLIDGRIGVEIRNVEDLRIDYDRLADAIRAANTQK